MRRVWVAAALALAGCGGSDERETTAPAKPVDGFAPGEWSARAALVSLDVPGEPRSRTRRMAAALAARMVPTRYCVTVADARRPPLALFGGEAAGKCRYERMAMARGRIDGALMCERAATPDAPAQTAMRMTIGGTYTATAYRFELRARYLVPGRADVTSRMRLRGVRRGECSAGA